MRNTLTRVLRLGTRGDDVAEIQAGLNQLPSILPRLATDGIYGNKTTGRVQEFQRQNQLSVDGVFGTASFAMLLQLLGDAVGISASVPPVVSGPQLWGVDCVAQADKPFANASTLYDYVVASAKQPPSFFGRYLTTNPYQCITTSEKDFLRARNCRLLLCFNQLSRTMVQGSRESGQARASVAARLANSIGAPVCRNSPSAYIYANIDSGYQPTASWLAGWLDGVWNEGYGPGLYFPAGGSTLIGKAIDLCAVPNPEVWVSIWTWSDHRHCSRDSGSAGELNVPVFSPIPPVGYPTLVRVWQYAGPCFPYRGDKSKAFDMDVANQAGYATMWLPT